MVALPAWPRPGRALVQGALFLGAYVAYGLTRWVATGDLGAALRNAAWVARLEHHAGVAVEPAIQHALMGTPAIWVLDQLYLAAQIAVVPAVLVVAYRRDAAVYRRLRDTVLATWLLAVPVFWAFPVAPPRLAHLGLVDTLSGGSGALNSRLATSLYNPLAAVPSLHCGFALAVSIAGWRLARGPWGRLLAAAWAPLVVLAVLATANHFVFDVVAGLAATALGAGAAAAVRGLRVRRPAPAPLLHGAQA